MDSKQNEPASYTYAEAGVSIETGNALVRAIAPLARATRRPGADADLGGFGGFFDLKAAGFNDPLLVAANDGVGTKLKLAIDSGRHDGVGIDLVAMCANDLIVQGAEPLFFLDYYATGKLESGPVRDLNLIVDRALASSTLEVIQLVDETVVRASTCIAYVLEGSLENAGVGAALTEKLDLAAAMRANAAKGTKALGVGQDALAVRAVGSELADSVPVPVPVPGSVPALAVSCLSSPHAPVSATITRPDSRWMR